MYVFTNFFVQLHTTRLQNRTLKEQQKLDLWSQILHALVAFLKKILPFYFHIRLQKNLNSRNMPYFRHLIVEPTIVISTKSLESSTEIINNCHSTTQGSLCSMHKAIRQSRCPKIQVKLCPFFLYSHIFGGLCVRRQLVKISQLWAHYALCTKAKQVSKNLGIQ